YFTNLSDSLRKHLDGALEGMFANLNQSIEIAAKGTDALASAMETLGTVGSEYLPRLAGWFVRISRQFDSWLTAARSEEHTSELQSRENLVCRLLLEKKKKSQCRK